MSPWYTVQGTWIPVVLRINYILISCMMRHPGTVPGQGVSKKTGRENFSCCFPEQRSVHPPDRSSTHFTRFTIPRCPVVLVPLLNPSPTYEGRKSKRSIFRRCLRHGQIECKIDIITFKLKQSCGTQTHCDIYVYLNILVKIPISHNIVGKCSFWISALHVCMFQFVELCAAQTMYKMHFCVPGTFVYRVQAFCTSVQSTTYTKYTKYTKSIQSTATVVQYKYILYEYMRYNGIVYAASNRILQSSIIQYLDNIH